MRFPLISILLFVTHFSFSQNLLVNGSFEEENTCTEYKVNCAPEAWITNRDGFNNYFKQASRAFDGERCVAIEAGYSNKIYQRTFIRSRLLCGLRKDHLYKLELYVKSPHPILDSIGVIFTSFDFLFGKKKLQNLTPSLFLQPANGSFVNDSSWQKVSMNYMAKGDEAYISIANFSRRDVKGEPNTRMVKQFLVFVDQISLTPVNKHEHLCAEWRTNQLEIYEQDERHEFLRQLVRLYNDNPPTVVLPSTILALVDTLLLPDMLFASGKTDLQKNSYAMLDDFCRKLAGKKIDSIVIEGHTDNTGTPLINERLAMGRASIVEEAIRQRLALSQMIIVTRGWADKKPVTTNNSAAGRQQNRRVELFVYARE